MIVLQCDEHISKALIRSLKAKGVPIFTSDDEKLRGMSDKELFQFCQKKSRVLFTNDTDFFSIGKENDHQGIIFLTNQQAPIRDVIKRILFFLYSVSEEQWKNGIFYVP